MNFTFENQGANTYLVYEVQPNDSIDTLSLGMLTNNKVLGLSPVLFTQMDSTKYIKYNVTAHVSVSQFFSGAVNKKRLIGVFKGIVNAMLSAEEYMIEPSTILLDLDYMFTDVSTCETVLVCLPIIGAEQTTVNMGAFFKNIVFGTQFDQTENCDYVAKLINYLNSTPNFSLADFKNILDSLETGTGAVYTQQSSASANNVGYAKNTSTAASPLVNNSAIQSIKPVQGASSAATATAPAPTSIPTSNPAHVKQAKIKAPVAPKKQPKAPEPFAEAPRIHVPDTRETSNSGMTNNQETPAEKISFFYLMQHYNKENAEAYKAQKAAKKSGNASQKVVSKQALEPRTAAKNNGKSAPNRQTPGGFAVPGQPNVQENEIIQQTNVSQPPIKQSPTVPSQTIQSAPSPTPIFVPNNAVQGQMMNFGETTVLGAVNAGETTVLGVASNVSQTATPYLIRSKNNEKIALNKPIFRIGKERSYVDYFIGDNTAISRSHANIIVRNGEFYIMDTNSTNHTYVNGNMINSNEEVKLSSGDTIKLANEGFEFKIF